MPEWMKKIDFIEMIRSARRELDSVLSEFTLEQMEGKGKCMEWTVKDVLAHIGWYENEMVNLLSQKTLEGSVWWNFSLQERNDAIHAANRSRDIRSVIESESAAYKTMLKLLEGLDEADMNDPSAFAGMPEEWQPWSVIASNTHEHYRDHVDQLKSRLKKPGSE
jgi:hypothetical protein